MCAEAVNGIIVNEKKKDQILVVAFLISDRSFYPDSNTKSELYSSSGRTEDVAHLSFRQQQRFVGLIPKERRVVQLEEHKTI